MKLSDTFEFMKYIQMQIPIKVFICLELVSLDIVDALVIKVRSTVGEHKRAIDFNFSISLEHLDDENYLRAVADSAVEKFNYGLRNLQYGSNNADTIYGPLKLDR